MSAAEGTALTRASGTDPSVPISVDAAEGTHECLECICKIVAVTLGGGGGSSRAVYRVKVCI